MSPFDAGDGARPGPEPGHARKFAERLADPEFRAWAVRILTPRPAGTTPPAERRDRPPKTAEPPRPSSPGTPSQFHLVRPLAGGSTCTPPGQNAEGGTHG
jgi:hypothetical protein